MAGWRLGYCVGSQKIVEGLAKIKGYYDYGIFSAIQVAGIVAMRDCGAEIVDQVERYRQRRDILCDGLEKMGWSVNKPQTGMFDWVKLPEPFCKLGSMQFATQLMQKANVAVAPGIGFGEEGENYLRLAMAENEHRIRQATRQMRRALPKIGEAVDSSKY
jgi:alanine-synthesizing transaminase